MHDILLNSVISIILLVNFIYTTYISYHAKYWLMNITYGGLVTIFDVIKLDSLNIGLAKGMLANVIKPFRQRMLTNNYLGFMTFTWGLFFLKDTHISPIVSTRRI